MVAVIKSGYSLHRIFNYNENKVKEGVATCIGAVNYPKDLQDLTLSNKLNRLLNVASLRDTVKRKAVHISLNFHPSEKFSHEKLQAIADSYMAKIGFGDQPYLVYEHTDSGHPHIHIVTVKVDDAGNGMKTNNLGLRESTQARLMIEKDFGLVPAQGRNPEQIYEMGAVNSKVIEYGKGPTKQAIGNILEKVLDTYNFTSLHELNAVLKLFNVTADRGKEDGIVYKNKGLYFRVLDGKTGKMIGVPIKASDFHFKPTLAKLEEKFPVNKDKITIFQKKRIRNAIDLNLNGSPKISLAELILCLQKQGIATVLRQKKSSSPIYGLTFVDHQTKLVINGSDLGKLYSANAIQERCRHLEVIEPTKVLAFEPKQARNKLPSKDVIPAAIPPYTTLSIGSDTADSADDDGSGKTILETLLESEYQGEFIPSHLKLHRKKRRKNRFNNN